MSTTPSKRANAMLWMAWLACGILGLWGVYLRMTQGHLPAGYGSYVPWGLWVALYFHGVGMAGGVFLIGALGYILRWPGLEHPASLRITVVLSMACILPAFMGVWFDLGHMDRASNIFQTPAFTSMMAFNAWMYNAFMVIAVVIWLLTYRKSSGWLRPLLCVGLFLSVAFPSQSGAFFGVVDAKAYWHSALLPMLFLTSAVTAGSALLLLVRHHLGGDGDPALPRIRLFTLVGLIVYFVFEFAEFSIALWNPVSHAPAIELVLFGPYWWVFWIVHLVIGGAIPLALLVRKTPSRWWPAALLLAVTFVSTRLNVLVPGQAVGEIRGLQEAFWHPRLTYIYHATPMEYLVGLFMIAAGMTIFFIGFQISRRVERSTGGAA